MTVDVWITVSMNCQAARGGVGWTVRVDEMYDSFSFVFLHYFLHLSVSQLYRKLVPKKQMDNKNRISCDTYKKKLLHCDGG